MPVWPDALDFLMLALASWRLAAFLVRERGPGDVALRLREAVGIEHDGDGRPESWPDPDGTLCGVAAQVLSCVWCCSAYTSALMLVLWLSGPGVVLVLAGAVAGAAVVIEVVVGRLQDEGGR